ncbi:hypothetical protein JCM10207_003976 [Rhodosporidiobolus poonsookiae]
MPAHGKALIWQIQAVCALSYGFLSRPCYDQGITGGVKHAPDYVRTMDLGYITPAFTPGSKVSVTVTDSTKQLHLPDPRLPGDEELRFPSLAFSTRP